MTGYLPEHVNARTEMSPGAGRVSCVCSELPEEIPGPPDLGLVVLVFQKA